MRKIFFGIFLSLFFYLNVQALFIKAEKDNHKAQTGYITTVKESNVQNIAFAEKIVRYYIQYLGKGHSIV